MSNNPEINSHPNEWTGKICNLRHDMTWATLKKQHKKPDMICMMPTGLQHQNTIFHSQIKGLVHIISHQPMHPLQTHLMIIYDLYTSWTVQQDNSIIIWHTTTCIEICYTNLKLTYCPKHAVPINFELSSSNHITYHHSSSNHITYHHRICTLYT